LNRDELEIVRVIVSETAELREAESVSVDILLPRETAERVQPENAQ
jgi:hypothetical protein